MQRHFIGMVLVFAAATAFGEEVRPPAATSATTSAPPAATTSNMTTPADTPRNNYKGYRLVKKEGEDDRYCRKQKMTGSRTKVVETCLTLEEITVLRETGQDMMERVRGIPGSSSSMDSNGGLTNSVSSPMQ